MHRLTRTTTFFFVLITGSTMLTTAFGQSRFSIAPTVSVGYRIMNFNYQQVGNGAPTQLTGSGSYHIVAIGLSGYYAFSKRGSVSVGIVFSRFTGIEKISSGNGNALSEGLGSGADNLQFPILVNYTTYHHRLSPYLSAGVVVSRTNVDPVAYYMGLQQTQDDPSVIPGLPPKTVRIQALAGAGAQYQFAPTVALIVQPTATYAFGRPSAGYAQYRVYNVGVQTQLKCTF